MGTCENILNDPGAITNEIQDTHGEEAKDLEHNKTLMKLIACQREIDELGKLEYDQLLEEIKTSIIEECKCTLKESFERRNEVISKIPDFWMNAISSNPKLPFSVNEFELVCLKYLSRFEMDDLADMKNGQKGFKLSFTFSDNPYIENDVISKQFSWGLDGIISSSCTPIIWKKDAESNPLQTESQNPLSFGRCTFFEWLADNEGPKSINFLLLVELWQDPVRYFTLTDNYCNQDGNEEIIPLLDEIKKYQEDINTINEKLGSELVKSASLIGNTSEEFKKGLYDERKRLIKDIPKFWATAMTNHPELHIIGDNERDCLQYLVDIDLKDMKCSEEHVSKMSVHFYFSENPYITNSVISKEYTRKDGERSVKSTQIEWKEDKSLFSKTQDCGDCSCKNSERNVGNFFDWLQDDSSPPTNSHITLSVLSLMQNPVQYYIKAVQDNVS